MIHQTDGKLIQSFKHPSTVYGCDWNPNNESIIATACEDGLVRIYYVGTGTDQPLKILSGHKGKVFRVKWSPLKDGILCSTSDDCSVRVWHYARGIAVRVLEGHTSYTRGLVWCPELPNIVISGSWDSTIAVWDISDGACLDIIEDHGADVYGLACHAERPFLLASTSRDSTVRFWSMLPLVSSLYLKILTFRPLNDVFSPSNNQGSEDFTERFGLYGSQSKRLKDVLSRSEPNYGLNEWKTASALFCPPSGRSNMWDLLLILKDKEIDFSHYKNGITHKKHVIKLTVAKALEKELANVSFFGSGVNSCGKRENLQRAAEYHLLTGNLKKYCELKAQQDEWLEAIALAPGVSLNFWKELTVKWQAKLCEENSELVAPFLIATNKADDLVKHYVKQNSLEKAHIVSIAMSEGLMPSASVSSNESLNHENTPKTFNFEKLTYDNIKRLAERNMISGLPVKGACWYLSNSDIQGALYCLLRGHELELVVSVCLSLQIKNTSFKMALIYLAWRCVKNREWDMAIETLDLCTGTEGEKIAVCVNCELSIEEKNFLHEKAKLPSVEECGKIAKEKHSNQGCPVEIIQFYLLSNNYRQGLDIGLKYVKEALTEPKWNLESIWQLLHLMSCVNINILQDISFDRYRFELQVYAAYVGALLAMRQGFYPIIVPLFSTAMSLIRRVHNPDLSITEDQISSEMHAWVKSKNANYIDSESSIFKEMMARTLEDPPYGDVGVTIVSGSNLPRHSDHHRCFLRGTAIRGPVYFLDDSNSATSLNDALMWAKVNRFSPLKTGSVINPF